MSSEVYKGTTRKKRDDLGFGTDCGLTFDRRAGCEQLKGLCAEPQQLNKNAVGDGVRVVVW